MLVEANIQHIKPMNIKKVFGTTNSIKMDKNDNIIDLGNITVPTSWNDITLKKYSEIERFYENTEKNVDIREIVHILIDKDIDYVNMLPLEFLENIMEKLIFLQEKPTEEEPRNWVEIDGERYEIKFMEKLKTGEYISADSVIKNDPHNYAAILAILCRKDGEIYDSKFEAEVFEDRVKLFEKQPITKILCIISFFLNLYVQSEIPSRLYTMVEEALDLTAKNIANSQKIGGWKRLYTRWQITRLRKLLKSSKNTSQTSSHSLRTLLRKGKWKKRKINGKKRGAKR